MKVILAETGTEFELDIASLEEPNELYSIKKKVEDKVNIKYSEQILVSATGVQLKESDTKISGTYDTIVVFNRRLLQDPACVQRLVGSIKLTQHDDLPLLQQVEGMSLYEGHVFTDTIHRIVQICVRRNSTIDQLTNEINAQTIALNAAFNNLESHVRAAHQNIGKFDRIAQREFAKHAISIASIDLDIELLQTIQLHPRACHISNSTQLDPNTTLGKLVPIKELEKYKHLILTKYDQLVSATLEQKNKVSFLYQQTANLSTQIASSQLSIQHVTKIKNEISHSIENVREIEKKILHQIKRVKKKDSLYLELNGPPSPPRSMDSTIQYSRNKIVDLVKTLYVHQAFTEQAEVSVRQEKKDYITCFVHCMQSISQVEESITKIYPKLADLEKEIKLLRRDIEKGNGTTARRVIAGYGVLLIELWRRDKYTEIVKENANLLQTLFSEFGQLEQSYRKGFEQEIICVDKQHMLSTETQAILPFQMQNMDEPPIICTTDTVNESEENIVIVTRAKVEEYIQMVRSFYAGSISDTNKRPRSNKLTTEQTTRDVSHLLTQRLEREVKRIRIGLSKLGLPNSSVNENNPNENAKGFSPSFSSSATSSHYFTPDMKLASPTSHMSTNIFYQQQSDWELEKTSILRQAQDYRKYIEDLNIKHEKDKQSLLRKVQLQEQRIEEIKGNCANQAQEFQSKIQNAEKYHKIKEQEWKRQYEAILQTEQEKYDRRVNGFHQRMHAKDQELAKLEETYLRETKSAPSSPVSSTFPLAFPQHSGRRRFRNQQSPPVVSKEQYDHDINLLQQEIAQLRTGHQQERAHFESQKSIEIDQITTTLQNQHTAQLKQVADALQSEHTCKNQELLLLIHALESEKKSYVEKLSHFDALKEQMDLDRTKEFELHQTMLQDLKQEIESLKQTNQTKLLQLTEKFQKSESRLKSLFINENQQLTMQCQARIENLVAEHQNNLQELSDTLENEKQVVRIKHQTAFEELNRTFTNQKMEWDQKLSVLSKQNQKINSDYTNFKKETRLKTKELTNLQQELKTAKRIANDVLSVSIDSNHQKLDPNTPLVDLLRKALSNVSSLKTRTSIMESMDSPYLMSSYGY